MADFLKVDVKHGLDQMLDGLEALDPRNIPFATALALTRTAKAVEQYTREKMASHMDRPTPFTLNSLFTRPATKQRLEAIVMFKDFAAKGAPAGKYLQPITEGRTRGDKSTERKLKNAGVIRKDQYIVPAKNLGLNGYGNVPAARYVQILSYLKASGESGYLANRTAKSMARNAKQKQFFVVQEDDKRSGLSRSLPPGIYERLAGGGKGGKAVRMIFALVRQPKYAVKFPFYQEAQEQSVKLFPEQIKDAIEFVAKQPRRK